MQKKKMNFPTGQKYRSSLDDSHIAHILCPLVFIVEMETSILYLYENDILEIVAFIVRIIYLKWCIVVIYIISRLT